MEENKLIKLFKLNGGKSETPKEKQTSYFSMPSKTDNLQKMFFFNLQEKKSKFKLKDLFK